MKLIEPKVELLSELDITPESHIARCARVCYGRECKEPNQETDEKMMEGLIKRGHLSMLRHASVYISHLEEILPYLEKHIANSPYWNYSMYLGYASTNLQEFMQSKTDRTPVTDISNKQFLEECSKYPDLFNLYRLTFCITTQISTSRELNRVSPNNIAERSTRYCSSKDGLEVCKPWWWNDGDTGINTILYEEAVHKAELNYQGMINYGLKPEDARGILPLDTTTKVIYTYSIREWEHILDLRLCDKTGKAHPNCHVVMEMVRDQINQFAKEHNIDYQV
jgi:thymidylate synthase (FAD)